MKIKTSILPLFTVSTGVLGMIFRFWLDTAGTDKEGLIIRSHPSVALMFIVAAVTLLVLGVCAWSVKETKHFARSVAGAVGCFVAGLGVLISGFSELATADDIVGKVSFAFSLLAAVCIVLFGIGRLQGKPAHLITHIITILYFMIHLVMQYRAWCATPQLYDYFFPLLSSVFLMLFVYHRACKDLTKEKEGAYLFFGQAALFCCFLSLTGSSWLFYASMAAWTTLDLFPRKEQ